ncbi:hypothetical protein L1987_04875 [Smallanthus sonchifolius]|uniref:Uncharacterized protein n=1 Tax=Smallanthus sonchifolius TaxID=185202 RepID=A0ACB9JTT0_9ASTR|nr:hypothetical protein L1987_04875 [Smallanthus sonchifolius]
MDNVLTRNCNLTSWSAGCEAGCANSVQNFFIIFYIFVYFCLLISTEGLSLLGIVRGCSEDHHCSGLKDMI